MTDTECIIFAFAALGKTADAVVFPVGDEIVSSTGEYFMPIGLVANIPDELVIWRIINVMKCNRKFYHAQAGSKMTPINANNIDDILP